jgi:hypothetical protein
VRPSEAHRALLEVVLGLTVADEDDALRERGPRLLVLDISHQVEQPVEHAAAQRRDAARHSGAASNKLELPRRPLHVYAHVRAA